MKGRHFLWSPVDLLRTKAAAGQIWRCALLLSPRPKTEPVNKEADGRRRLLSTDLARFRGAVQKKKAAFIVRFVKFISSGLSILAIGRAGKEDMFGLALCHYAELSA